MYIKIISLCLNLILAAVLIVVNKQEKQRARKRKEMEKKARDLLYMQELILRNNDYSAMSVELEITKYLRDILVPCIVEGKFTEIDEKRLHPIVIRVMERVE